MWVKRSGVWWQVLYVDADGFENGWQAWVKRNGEWWWVSFIQGQQNGGTYIKYNSPLVNPTWDSMWFLIRPPDGFPQPPAPSPTFQRVQLTLSKRTRSAPLTFDEVIEWLPFVAYAWGHPLGQLQLWIGDQGKSLPMIEAEIAAVLPAGVTADLELV